MRSVMLQDWTTIRGSGTLPVVQALPDWLDVAGFADAIFWIEVLEVTNPGAGSVSLALETAPVQLESLFAAIDTVFALAPSATPLVRKVFLNATPGTSLARYLRWKLTGSTSGTWDVAFRVHVTLGTGARNAFSPLQLPGLLAWYRADQGLITSGSAASQWSDLSGNGFHVYQGTGASQPLLVQNGIGGRPTLDFSGGKLMSSSGLDMITPGGSAYSVLAVAKNGSGALFTLRTSNVYSASIFYLSNTYVFSDGVNPAANMTVSNTLAETQSSTNAFKSCHRYKGVGTLVDIFLNGSQRAITSGAPPTTQQTTENGSAGFVMGSDAASQTWGGQIAEIIVMSGAISSDDRLRVERYQLDFFGV